MKKNKLLFLTTGTQEPFDRLVRAIDEVAHLTEWEIIVQAIPGEYIPTNFKSVEFMEPMEYEKILNRADIVISHAGIGIIMKCIEAKKTAVLLARDYKFKEHRNDHQIFTIEKIGGYDNIRIAKNVEDLKTILIELNKKSDKEIIRNELDASYAHLTEYAARFVGL